MRKPLQRRRLRFSPLLASDKRVWDSPIEECSVFRGISQSTTTFSATDCRTTTFLPFAAEREPFRACFAAVVRASPFCSWGEWPLAWASPLPFNVGDADAAPGRVVDMEGRSEGDARVETGDCERRALERNGSFEEGSPRRLGSCFRLS